ncbi:MobF family relaxase [Devosia sp. A369]
MVASIASGTTAGYYLSRTAYYLDGPEPAGSWLAGQNFGITAGQPLDADLFERLHAATDANGRSLLSNGGNRLEQIGGYDVTFSSPKSMSLLWALADGELRRSLEAVQRQAVVTAIALLDANAAYGRRGKDGLQLEKVALSVAGFQHGEARPALHDDGETFADFALHTHAVVLNLAARADGSTGRLDGRPLFAWKMAAGAQYHRALAQGLRQLGFAIEVTGKNGIFEVAGVDTALCAYFSARRKEIVDELEELGLETGDAPALAAAKALTTRRGKQDLDGVDRHVFWREKCQELGFSPEQVIAQAREQSQRQVQNHLDQPDRIDAVLAQLTERDSTFERRELVAAIAAALIELPDERTLDTELARLEAERHVIPLAHDGWGHAIYSTPEVIALERALFSAAQRLGALAIDAPHTDSVGVLLAGSGLNPEQAAAARIACSPVALTIIEGGPGVGKTTLLAPVTQAWQDQGWRVIGAASAWKIASQLSTAE